MQCAFCKSDMNEGATVCHACARRQPFTKKQKIDTWVIAALAVVALLVFGFLGFVAWDSYERDAAIDRIAAAAKLCGKGEYMTHDAITGDMEEMQRKGVDWRTAAKVLAFDACGYTPSD